MAIPANKIELKTAILENYLKLRADLNGIPTNLSRQKELEGHAKNTTMSVNDLLAYLIGWGQLVLKWHKNKELGKQVDFPETGYKWNELGKLAQKLYADHEGKTFDKLLHLFDKTVKDIVKLVDVKSNRDLYETDWYNGWPLGRLIQLNTSSPYDNASKRLRKWKKKNHISKITT